LYLANEDFEEIAALVLTAPEAVIDGAVRSVKTQKSVANIDIFDRIQTPANCESDFVTIGNGDLIPNFLPFERI
jgi:hypothetical protein